MSKQGSKINFLLNSVRDEGNLKKYPCWTGGYRTWKKKINWIKL